MFCRMDKRQLDCKRTAWPFQGQASPPMGPRGAIWPPQSYNSLLGSIILIISILRSSAQNVTNCSLGEVYLNATLEKNFIETPNFGKEYPSHMDCHFLLMAPLNYKIMIILEQVDMEFQLFDECLDFVSISKDNLQLKADTIAKICGSVHNRQVSSTDNMLKISFFSDMMIQGKGVRLSYQAIPPNECEPGWFQRGGSCLKLVNEDDGADFIQAQIQCSQQQANLLSITNEVDYNKTMLWLNNATSKPWIGYTDSSIEGTIKGLTEQGSRLWPLPQPAINGNEDSKDCIYLDLTATHWQQAELPYRIDDCRTKQSFICEKNIDGSTHPVTPPIEKIKAGIKRANFDLANLLFLLIVLILLAICCCICYSTCFRKANRVQPVTQHIAHADGSSSHQAITTQTQQVSSTSEGRSISPTVTAPPRAIETVRQANNIRVTTPPVASEPAPTIIPTVTEIIEEKPISPPPAPAKTLVTVVNEKETETAILPTKAVEEVPEVKPRTVPPLNVSITSPYQTMNTREDSFMRARIAQEMFERPKMELLDNVSAISLDEFWSNTKKKH